MAGKKILIVDDEPDILKAIAFRVKHAGYDTITATNGQEGLKAMREDHPDMVILDYRMPVMDGADVYLEMCSDDTLKEIPAMFLTASRESSDLKGRLDGLSGITIMNKPYEPEELFAKIKELLGE